MNSIEKAERFKERDFKITEEDLISPVSVDSHLNNQLFHNYNQFLKNCVRNYFDESGYLQFIDLIKLYKTHFKCGKWSFQFEKDEKIKTCKMCYNKYHINCSDISSKQWSCNECN